MKFVLALLLMLSLTTPAWAGEDCTMQEAGFGGYSWESYKTRDTCRIANALEEIARKMK